MAKPGRNDPCPCGSGKKFKKCCLAADEARTAPPPRATPVGKPAPPPWNYPYVFEDDDDLDELSNSVVDLIDAGKLDQAEQASHELLRRYPEVLDGHMRLGAVYKARGENQTAADHLRQAAAMAHTPDHDQELIDSLLAEANQLDPPAPK